jgi:hypothetical protein
MSVITINIIIIISSSSSIADFVICLLPPRFGSLSN